MSQVEQFLQKCPPAPTWSTWQADLACKQESHYGEEDGQDEEDVGGAHHGVVGKLIRLTSNFLDIEAHWEDEGGHAEQDHCGGTERRRVNVIQPQ